MFSKSFKIPLGFLIAGILWAFLSDPIITFFFGKINIHVRDIIRSANDFAFVGFAAVALYFKIKQQQQRILLSEKQYKRLFELNPNPMWVFNSDTLQFVEVNRSAIELYGYTADEFLSMTIKDIVSYDMDFNGKPSTLVMANDVTGLILKEEKIKSQNEALHEIAWLNSHEVRKSLCSVMSLTALLKDATTEFERGEYIRMIEQCTNELDSVLKKTNNRVDQLKEYDKADQLVIY